MSCLCKYHDELISTRRHLHTMPEEGWSEFTTTAYIVEKLRKLGYEVLMGKKVINPDNCLGRSQKVVDAGLAYARKNGVSEALLKEMDGLTGCVGVMDTGRPGPTLAIRFDIDCVPVTESTDADHIPAKEGFCSTRPGLMHACGHDAHTSTGLAVAHWFADHKDEMKGKLKILFQPAEEGVRGAAGMAASGIVDDADYFLGAHIAMMCKTGELSVKPYGFLCTTKLDVTYTGRPAHAGVEPNAGRNAMAAACNAFVQLLGIARHGSGMTRINVGQLIAGEGRNVIPSHALMKMEVRGETGDINQYMYDAAVAIIKGCAISQGCEYKIEKMGEAVDLTNDEELVDVLTKAGEAVEGMTVRKDPMNFGGSEDATILARRVQAHGGKAALFVIGANRPSGHHTSKFDIDEKALDQGLAVWTNAVKEILG
ncbi:amidohydrolase [Sutterella faecalis]|uniref:M20 family metallo-hydrolase n=2 Tax=Sutterella TaxID=40544 RepID=A0AAI9SB24_9BURK|nr:MULTISPECIES: amidohydrolase [Sutterella]KAB7650684.1 M20 family metallo-hydrolase [Sutterella seckii]QDA53585.1 amidohydrolase [Sutterella faecalis]